MEGLKRKDEEGVMEQSSSGKKLKHVGSRRIDTGVLANECIKIFLVNSMYEMDAASCVSIDPVYIPFDGEDEKIYGYKDLKISIYLNVISFHAYADIAFQNKTDGGKGITNLEHGLQTLLGTAMIDKKDFINTFTSEVHCVRDALSSGKVVHCDSCEGLNSASNANIDIQDSMVEVVRMNFGCDSCRLLYGRLASLVPLLIEGGHPVDVDDPCWEIYFAVKKTPNQSGETVYKLLGFAAAYHFYHYPDSFRLRISQILVLPPYQKQGHGRRLLKSVNSVAISENCYDVTFEDPSDYLQYLRTCIDVLRLDFEPINTEIISTISTISNLNKVNLSKRTEKFQLTPPAYVVEAAREKLKIYKKHFLRCWEVLVFCNIDRENKTCMDNFNACLSERLKGDIIGKVTSTDGKRAIRVVNDTSFVMHKCALPDGKTDEETGKEEHKAVQESLKQMVEERMKQIDDIAKKVFSMGFKSLN